MNAPRNLGPTPAQTQELRLAKERAAQMTIEQLIAHVQRN